MRLTLSKLVVADPVAVPLLVFPRGNEVGENGRGGTDRFPWGNRRFGSDAPLRYSRSHVMKLASHSSVTVWPALTWTVPAVMVWPPNVARMV